MHIQRHPFLFWKEFGTKEKLQMLVCAIVMLLVTPLFVRYGNQLIDREYGQTVDSGGFVALATYIIIIFAAFVFMPMKKRHTGTDSLQKEVCSDSFFLALTMIGCCFYFMRYIGTRALERISFYFMFGQLITLPSVIKNFDEKSRILINVLVIVLSISLFAYRLNGSDLLPYRFFWQ